MIFDTEDTIGPSTKEISKRFKTICDYLCQKCYGQEALIKLSLLAVIAKESISIGYSENDEKMIKAFVRKCVKNAFKNPVDNFEASQHKSKPLLHINQKELSDEDYLDYITNGLSEFTPSDEQSDALLTQNEIDDWQKDIDAIPFSNCVKQFILLNRYSNEISNVKRIIHIARTSAFLNGRSEVLLTDFCNVGYLKSPDEHSIGLNVLEQEFRLFIRKNFNPGYNYKKESAALNAQKGMLQSKYKDVLDKITEYFTFLKDFNKDKELSEVNLFKSQSELDDFLKSLYSEEKNLKETENHVKQEYEEIDFPYASDIYLGDNIEKDGSLNRSWGIAVICLKENTADSLFGISTSQWEEKDFTEAIKLASDYDGDGSEVYASDWILPSIEQMEQIYKNLEKSELSGLSVLSELKPKLSNRYWSSTKKDDNSVYYFDFSTGKKDYTTPDHKYNVALLHRFYCGKE